MKISSTFFMERTLLVLSFQIKSSKFSKFMLHTFNAKKDQIMSLALQNSSSVYSGDLEEFLQIFLSTYSQIKLKTFFNGTNKEFLISLILITLRSLDKKLQWINASKFCLPKVMKEFTVGLIWWIWPQQTRIQNF